MAEVTADGASLGQRFLVSRAVAYIRYRVPDKSQFSPTFAITLNSPFLRKQPLVRSSLITVPKRTGSTWICASVIRNVSWDQIKFPLGLPSVVFLFFNPSSKLLVRMPLRPWKETSCLHNSASPRTSTSHTFHRILQQRQSLWQEVTSAAVSLTRRLSRK
jgi:hypothetical protein